MDQFFVLVVGVGAVLALYIVRPKIDREVELQWIACRVAAKVHAEYEAADAMSTEAREAAQQDALASTASVAEQIRVAKTERLNLRAQRMAKRIGRGR